MTHLDTRLKIVKGKIPYETYHGLVRIFPLVYRTFFQVAKGRKNFMSYPYVIERLLEISGTNTENLNLKKIKTPCKVRDAQYFWQRILETAPEITQHMRRYR